MSLIAELKRRNVFRVAVAYAIVGWLLLEVASVVLPALHLPDWALTLLVVFVVAGFPLALILAWAFEMTPEGIRRETDVDRAESVRHSTGRKLDFAIIGLLAVAVVYFAVDKFVFQGEPEQAVVTTDSIPAAEPVAREKSIRSLAVLPLENLSGDPEQEYFADGMTEALIGDLAKIGALRVISRTSSMRYKNSDKSLPKIAQELNVDGVIEGTVIRDKDRIRITVQLIDARNDRNIWAGRYDRDLRDVLALQSEVAGAIAQEIKIELTLEEKARLATTRLVDPDAYELYLKGRFYWNKFTITTFQKAVEHFLQAIQEDRDYAPAHAGLADSYTLLGSHHGNLEPRKVMHKAKEAALRALEIDNTLADAHISLAMIASLFEWDWSSSEKRFQRAIALNPGSARTHDEYGVFLFSRNRPEEAEKEIRRALRLDPLSAITNVDLAMTFFVARRYDEAIEQCYRTLELNPNFVPAHRILGAAYVQKRMYAEAIQEIQKAVTLSGDNLYFKATLGYAYAVSGQTEAALQVLNELQEQARERFVSSVGIAEIYFGLGDKEQGFALLERAFEQGEVDPIYFAEEPGFQALSTNTQLLALLKKWNW